MSVSENHGLCCPLCGSDEFLDVLSSTYVRLTPDGADADGSFDGGHEWDRGSEIVCRNGECEFDGIVEDCEITGDEDMKDELGKMLPYPVNGGGDPDGSNRQRADRGAELVDKLSLLTGETDPEMAITAISEILHHVSASSGDPAACIAQACLNFTQETSAQKLAYTGIFTQFSSGGGPEYLEPLVFTVEMPRAPHSNYDDLSWKRMMVDRAQALRAEESGFMSKLILIIAFEGDFTPIYDTRF